MSQSFAQELANRGMSESEIAEVIAELGNFALAAIATELMAELPPEIIDEIEALPNDARVGAATEHIRRLVPIDDRAEIENIVLTRITADYIAKLDSEKGLTA